MKRMALVMACTLGLLAGLSAGCAVVKDAPLNVAGWSTRDLEDARRNSVYGSYSCGAREAFETVFKIAEDSGYTVFRRDEGRGMVVLMGIPGAVNTTEVAVYINPALKAEGVKIEVASRSAYARRLVARNLLGVFSEKYPKI